MQRVLRWDVPVDDQWHEIGAGYVLEVASRGYRDRPGDLTEVWTLEQVEDATFKAVENLPKRSVIVVGTGHQVPDNAEHIGTAVVPTHYLSHETDHTGNRQIRTSAGLVWHLFAKIDPADERQHVPLGHRVDGIVRSAKVETLEDEATSLAYWMANELGEHVDDQDGETLTQTVRRLLAVKLAPPDAKAVPITDWDDFQVGDVVVQNPAAREATDPEFTGTFLVRRPATETRTPMWTWVAGLPCPDCGQNRIVGYRMDNEHGDHMHTHYVCTFWAKGAPKACGWHGWSVPGWDAEPEES
jgi:hypothetical protein